MDKFGTPRQGALVPAAHAELVLSEALRPEQSLLGLAEFSHVWLVTWLSASAAAPEHSPCKVEPPRLRGERIGVFATRSPHRPNPIGLTLAQVVRVTTRGLELTGIDLMDGTLVLDIKPYMPEVDSAVHARTGWVGENPWPKVLVSFAPEFTTQLDSVLRQQPAPIDRDGLRQLIAQTLQLDPRANADLDNSPAEREFWLRLYDYDVRFHYRGNGIEVAAIRFARGTRLGPPL